jgi:hypothetical protein
MNGRGSRPWKKRSFKKAFCCTTEAGHEYTNLTDFSVKTRYDDGIYPTEDEMKNGLACAKQIRDFVLERMA